MNSRGFSQKLFEDLYSLNEITYKPVCSVFKYEKNNILCISAGIGITPFVQVLKERTFKHIHFFRDEEAEIYKQYLGTNSKLIVSSERLI